MNKKHLLMGGGCSLVLAVFISSCTTPPATPSTSIEVTKILIDDSSCLEDGKVSSGDTVKMRLELRNNGTTPIPGAEATLSTMQPGVHIMDSLATFPSIAPGDTVAQPSADPFVFFVDDTVATPTITFLLESSYYLATIVVQNFQNIYACIDTCQIFRGSAGTPDTLVIRLSICNESCGDLTEPAIRIRDSNVKLCGEPLVKFTKVKDEVFYDTISNNNCAGSANVCSLNEFRYTVSLGERDGSYCIHFMCQIYTGAIPVNCSIPLSAVHRKTMELCYVIKI